MEEQAGVLGAAGVGVCGHEIVWNLHAQEVLNSVIVARSGCVAECERKVGGKDIDILLDEITVKCSRHV